MHYSALCYAKTVAAVSTEGASNLDVAFLDSASTNQETAWFADVQIGDQETLKFKLDSGAEMTAISHLEYQRLSHPPLLNTTDKILYGPSRQPLHVLGQCHMDLTYKERSCN